MAPRTSARRPRLLDSRQPSSTEVPMRRTGVVLRGTSLVLALGAVEAQLGDALVAVRC